MSTLTLLFPAGIRLSSWVTLAVFGGFAVARRDPRFVAGAVAWAGGFEVAWQLTREWEAAAASVSWRAAPLLAAWILLAAYTTLVLIVIARRWSAPAPPVMAVVAALWTVWVTTGFHFNNHASHTMVGFDWFAEAINECAKTVWACAYLVPLLRRPRLTGASEPLPEVQAARAPVVAQD